MQYTIREKEKNYTDDQNHPDVVQPYAAYSPPGNVKVEFCITTTNHVQKLGIWVSAKKKNICPTQESVCAQIPSHAVKTYFISHKEYDTVVTQDERQAFHPRGPLDLLHPLERDKTR